MKAGRRSRTLSRATALMMLLGACAFVLGWLAAGGTDADEVPHAANVASPVQVVLPVDPSLVLPVPAAVERPAEPMGLVTLEPDQTSLDPAARGSLEIILTDTWGSELALGPFDF